MNNSIVYVGMDVHKESYTVCCYTFDKDKVEYIQKMKGDYKNILKYIEGSEKDTRKMQSVSADMRLDA